MECWEDRGLAEEEEGIKSRTGYVEYDDVILWDLIRDGLKKTMMMIGGGLGAAQGIRAATCRQ